MKRMEMKDDRDNLNGQDGLDDRDGMDNPDGQDSQSVQSSPIGRMLQAFRDSAAGYALIWAIRGALYIGMLAVLSNMAKTSFVPVLDDVLTLTERQMLLWECVYLYLASLALFPAIHEFNPPALRKTVRGRERLPKYLESLGEAIRSPALLLDLLWLIPPLFVGIADPIAKALLWPNPPALPVRLGLGLALWALPVALIDALESGAIRRNWIRSYLAQGQEGRAAILSGERTRGGYSVIRLTVNLAAVWFGIFILIYALMPLYSSAAFVWLLLDEFKFHLIAMLILIFLWRRLSYLRFRRRFEAKMRQVCAAPGCAFTVTSKKGRWRLKFSGREEYRLEIDGKIYRLCLLRIAHRFSRVYFETDGSYRYRLHFMQFNPFLPRHKLDVSGIGDGSGERVILLTKEPGVWLCGDTEAERYAAMSNGGKLYGCTFYLADDFCTFAERKTREKSL